VPDTAPDDPRERNHHLLAHVLIDLLTNPQRRGALRSEVIVTLRPDGQGATAPDWALPVELPLDVLSQIVSDPATLITPIVVSANGLVLHASGVLILGRSTRLANQAQRRALHCPPREVLSERMPRTVRPLQDPPHRVVATRWAHRSRQSHAALPPAPHERSAWADHHRVTR
jgi:hypothetical protein